MKRRKRKKGQVKKVKGNLKQLEHVESLVLGRSSSVGDPRHFGVDPDLRISTSDLRIRIQLLIRILSSVTLRMQKKISYFFS